MNSKFIKSLALIFIVSINNLVFGQTINGKKCQAFLDTKEFYIIDTKFNTTELTTNSGEVITFEKLIRENWPDKEIIKITEKNYNNLKDVKNKFHTSIVSLSVKKDFVEIGAIDGMVIQQGKTGKHILNILYWSHLNFEEISKGILPERLTYVVKNTKELLVNYNDASTREKYLYRVVDYDNLLRNNILYFKRDDMVKGLQSSEELKKYYKNDFKIVSNEEWAEVLKQKKDNAVLVELMNGGKYTAIVIYKANGDKLLMNSFPWNGYFYRINPTFIRKVFKSLIYLPE